MAERDVSADTMEEAGDVNSSEVRARPYVRTQGRTDSRQQLPVEALVTTRTLEAELPATLRRDNYRAITRPCRTPRSVADVATALRIPLGAARVLLADLAEHHVVTVHSTRSEWSGNARASS